MLLALVYYYYYCYYYHYYRYYYYYCYYYYQGQDEQFDIVPQPKLSYWHRCTFRLRSLFKIKFTSLQNVGSQSLLQFIISFFITISARQCSTLQLVNLHLLHSLIVLSIVNKCLIRSVISFFIMFKCAPMQHAASKHLLQSLIFHFIIKKCAPLPNICLHMGAHHFATLTDNVLLYYACSRRLLQSVIGLFVIVECTPLCYNCEQCHFQSVIDSLLL